MNRLKFWVFLLSILCVFDGAARTSAVAMEIATVRAVPTNRNYYLATLINESDYYDPTFFDDYLLVVDGSEIAHFTRMQGEVVDVFFYVEDPDTLSALRETLKNHRETLDALSPHLYDAFITYRTTMPRYARDGLYKQVQSILTVLTHITVARVVGHSHHLEQIDQALYQYLRSNGITDLSEIRDRPDLVNLLVNKFYMLCTTYFFREWAYIKAFTDHLEPFHARQSGGKAPFKAKIFACSTGEEVLSFAIELLESGIEDFRILATDINDAGLEQARTMRYPAVTLDRLPLKTREKIFKHFRLNPSLDVYEPVNPEWFQSRILYQNQDILRPLPENIPAEFAPPYDLMSILNVLLYLEDAAVQNQKHYWAELLNPGAILVLHDAQFSIAKGNLDPEWGFQNFLSVNEYVNILCPEGMSRQDRVAFYETNYDANSETSFILLWRAYTLTQQLAKAQTLTEEYLERHPLSYTALLYAYEKAVQAKRLEEGEGLLKTILQAYPFQMGTINKLMENRSFRNEQKFLETLKINYMHFLTQYRLKPEAMKETFDFQKPEAGSLEPLRMIFQAMAHSFLAQFYIQQKSEDRIESTSLQGLAIVENLYQKYPEYIAAGKFLNELITGLVQYYIDEGRYDQAYLYCNRGLQMFEEGFRNQNYYYILEGLGMLHLKKSILLERQGMLEESLQAANDSVFFFEQAVFLLQDLFTTKHSYFYGDIGLAYFRRARFLIQQDKQRRALGDLRKAMSYFEEALEMNPLYGKEIARHRADLLDLIQRENITI